MSRGGSAGHGRSRCCAKIGPGSRSHKKRSVLRAETERTGSVPRQLPRHQSLPNWRRDAPAVVDLPPETKARPVLEPVVSTRRLGGKTVEVFDYSGGAP